MHDFFDVLGLSSNASIGEVRRVCARRVRRFHPDFRQDAHCPAEVSGLAADVAASSRDLAVDFVDMTTLVDRIEHSFFHSSC